MASERVECTRFVSPFGGRNEGLMKIEMSSFASIDVYGLDDDDDDDDNSEQRGLKREQETGE